MTTVTNVKPADRPDQRAMFSKGDYVILHTAIAKLPRLQQRIISMRYWEGLSVTELRASLRSDFSRPA